MKYKIGDKIVPKNGIWTCGKADDARADYAVITQTGRRYHYDLYKDSKKVDWCSLCQNDTNSKLMEKTMEDLQKGDVIISKSGREHTVIERLGDIVFTTGYENNWDDTVAWNTTELKDRGFTIKQPETEPTEITMQQIADEFGVDVSKLKITKG